MFKLTEEANNVGHQLFGSPDTFYYFLTTVSDTNLGQHPKQK